MKMKYLIIALLALVLQVSAQTTNPPTFIKGGMDIKFDSRANKAKGVKDTYKLDINVCNLALFHGTVLDTPQIIEGYISKTISQKRSLKYEVACDLVNPKRPDPSNPANVLNVGKLFGIVPIASDGTYNYDSGSLVTDILPLRGGAGMTSKFTGIAVGKPLERPANWRDTLNRTTVNITRSINGKVTTVALKRYDKMEFRQQVIGAGPSTTYPSVTVNGEALYDYDKECWFFKDITCQYAGFDNTVKFDRLGGTIRWVEPKRGEGEYQFDIRVNEPLLSASAAFNAKPADDSAFFETDNTVPSLTGTMQYKDSLRGDTTMASQVAINLVGNNITPQQTMVLCKMVIFSMVVPMNSD